MANIPHANLHTYIVAYRNNHVNMRNNTHPLMLAHYLKPHNNRLPPCVHINMQTCAHADMPKHYTNHRHAHNRTCSSARKRTCIHIPQHTCRYVHTSRAHLPSCIHAGMSTCAQANNITLIGAHKTACSRVRVIDDHTHAVMRAISHPHINTNRLVYIIT